MMIMELPEEKNMWEERVAVEVTEDQTKDPFIPAIETQMNKYKALVYVEL
jgi:hypothetical protein